MKRFFWAIGLLFFMISSVVAAEYTIKLTHVVSPNTPKGKAADLFAKRVGELTAGSVEVSGSIPLCSTTMLSDF